VHADLSLAASRASGHEQKLSEHPAGRRLAAGHVARDLELVEDAVDRGEELWELGGKLGMIPSHLRKREELLANQVVECALRTEASLDCACGLALLDPDLLESHGQNSMAIYHPFGKGNRVGRCGRCRVYSTTAWLPMTGFAASIVRAKDSIQSGLDPRRCRRAPSCLHHFARHPAKEEGISLGDVSTARRCASECQWLKPVLVGQFEFLEWTGENHLRHSKCVGLREDKKATDVVRE
jgi:hypothetical protein